jgi:hypothetical protein
VKGGKEATAMANGIESTSGKGYPSLRRTLATTALSFSLLAPCAAHPARIWQAAQCTIAGVTARATSCYDTIRFVYCVQRQSEQHKAAE